ncbi:uncharacterized protein LOC107729863 [Sinocyclocheilus rhinocerous]|uniref:uncharacterized protein LOC107729863 n=1 Tax=Sinocyclocheilus rhinocerous TaxID=307959 RepID=UPI0007BA61D0|nr:PREDICTED: uncharacterized protein LOC107729863 [Sinocyclocheilus rhinocerous]
MYIRTTSKPVSNRQQASSQQNLCILSVKMLAALVLVLLVFSVTEGRIMSKCELKEQLEASQIQVIRSIGDKMTKDKLIARLVCNVENTSGFNTSLVTSIQDEIRPAFQIPPKPKEEKPPAKEEDDEKLEEEHIIPVKPQSPPKGRSGRSVPEGKTAEILGAKERLWTWRRGLFPEKIPADSSGSGPEAMSEEDSSGDSSEEEGRDDVIAWDLLGIFQLSDHEACDPGSSASLNLCGLECSALVDDDISDDIACLKILAGSSNKFSGLSPKKRFLAQMLAMLPVKECRSVLPSKYFAECS